MRNCRVHDWAIFTSDERRFFCLRAENTAGRYQDMQKKRSRRHFLFTFSISGVLFSPSSILSRFHLKLDTLIDPLPIDGTKNVLQKSKKNIFFSLAKTNDAYSFENFKICNAC